MLWCSVCYLWSWRGSARIAVLTFGDDLHLIETIKFLMKPAIRTGVLRLASGGLAGRQALQNGTAIASGVGATALPEEAVPADRADVSRVEMKFWHASVAKNGAHLFG